MKRVCYKCKEEKDLNKFPKNKRGGLGLDYLCKVCKNKRKTERSKEKILEKNSLFYIKRNLNVYEKFKKKEENIYKNYIRQKYIKQNKKKCEKCNKVLDLENFEEKRFVCRSCRNKNKNIDPEKRREYRRKYRKFKMKTDPIFAMKRRLRNRISESFSVKYWKKEGSTEKLLGADYNTVFNHIESQFVEGMSWNNRNEWHIDHIIPLYSAKTEEELIKLCHYTNLQPLWAKDNLKKGNKIL